jgi:DNA-binding XRE family transcriptional regulator
MRAILEAGYVMTARKPTTYEEFEAELLERPGVRREFEALQPKYDLIRALIQRRHEQGISQTQLARMVGMQQPAISRLENGSHSTAISTFLKVASALDLEISLKARA